MLYFEDGSVLAQLTNVLKPGTIEKPVEKPSQKEEMLQNIKGFLNFAKNDGGVAAAEKVKAEEVVVGRT